MEQSKMFNSLKGHYDAGRYTDAQMKVFVQAKWITEAEYGTITGKDYKTGEPITPAVEPEAPVTEEEAPTEDTTE